MTRRRGALDELGGPADLQRLPAEALPGLADEIRERLISSVTQTGGHLGPNLGVVELTIALHRSFESPGHVIVWDIGHQAYVHKMLTGRQHDFAGLRQGGGLSGYPSRAESPHDIIENSHASTALSYADGLAKGMQVTRSDRRIVAVVGDGALTGGMCWEALNNLGRGQRPVVIVFNDNGRSYEPTAGSIADHFRGLRTGEAAGNVFRDFGLGYIGPIDGHDVGALEDAFAQAGGHTGPVVVHCLTRKGAGYEPAETDDADHMHTIGARRSGGVVPATPDWSHAFGQELVELGVQRDDIVAVTAAMMRPTGLYPFAQKFPERVFDVGIAEQHAVTSAAGLATAGLHPVVAIYATFLNRAFDQVLMDVALHKLPVTFVLERAGITGPDGPSHHGMWDLSMLNTVPGIRIAAPRDAGCLTELLAEAVADDRGPTVVRIPTGHAPTPLPTLHGLGSADVLFADAQSADGQPADGQSGGVLLLPVGVLANAAVDAAERLREQGISATVADPRWVTPVDPALVRAANEFDVVVTIEDNSVSGGFGDALARAFRAAGMAPALLTLGLAPQFVRAGTRTELLRENGLDAKSIATAAIRSYRVVRGQ